MGVDEGLVPGVLSLVLDLNDVSQGSGAIGASEVLDRRRVAIVLAIELSLDLRDDGLDADGRSRSRDLL